MNRLLKTMAAFVLAASMIPVFTQASEQSVCNTEICEQQKDETDGTVDLAAAWAHGLTRVLGISGTLAVGIVKSASLASPIPFIFSIPCAWIWAYYMDDFDGLFGINKATKAQSVKINNHLCHGILGIAGIAAYGVAAQSWIAKSA